MMEMLFLIFYASFSLAKTVTYDFEIGWVSRSPDGYQRPVMGVNGQWPLPTIEADLGDTIVVKTTNSLGNQTTSLHFHGMYQKNSTAYDGGVGISQCPMYPEDSFTYTFKADPAGTSWYHGHDKGQYPDGLRGLLIVHDPEWEKSLNVDEQIYLSVSDWYRTEHSYIVNDYLHTDNTDGTFPSPDCLLFNESRTPPDFDFEPHKRYLIRLASMASLACTEFHIENHILEIVGVDGIHTHPHITDAIKICPGQRYDILVVGLPDEDQDFNWITKMRTDMLTKNIPSDKKLSVIGNVRYPRKNHLLRGLRNKSFRGRKGKGITAAWKPEKVLDDMELKPLDNTPLLQPVDCKINLASNQTYYDGLGTRTGMGGQPWTEPKVPTLFTVLTTGDHAFNKSTYGPGVDPYIIHSDEVVQVYMENSQDWPHPMHIHGHSYQVVARGQGSWDENEESLPKYPMMRDTAMIPAHGYIVIRYRADNPGVWFFHCHIDLHLVGGMASTFIEAPDLIQKHHSIPDGGHSVCEGSGKGSKGNCAGGEGFISAEDAESECNTIWTAGGDGNVGVQLPANWREKRKQKRV